jgi:hypothetical protein
VEENLHSTHWSNCLPGKFRRISGYIASTTDDENCPAYLGLSHDNAGDRLQRLPDNQFERSALKLEDSDECNGDFLCG